MSKTINTKIDDGILTFTFTNNQNEIFASFRLNPTDVNIAARAEEVSAFFEKMEETVKNVASAIEAAKLNELIQDKINYLLGYEASKDLFREPITATTVFGNGQMVANIVLDQGADAIAPEIEK